MCTAHSCGHGYIVRPHPWYLCLHNYTHDDLKESSSITKAADSSATVDAALAAARHATSRVLDIVTCCFAVLSSVRSMRVRHNSKPGGKRCAR